MAANSGSGEQQERNIRIDGPPLQLEKTIPEMQAEIDAIAAPLIELLFPCAIFDVSAALREGHSFKGYLRVIRNVSNLQQQGVLESVVSLGGNKKFWGLHTRAKLEDFVAFSRWLSTQEGQDAVYKLQRTSKLKRKAGEARRPEDVALVEIMDNQRQKYNAEVKEVRATFEDKIFRYQEKVRRARKEMADTLTRLKGQFEPSSLFDEPADEEIGRIAINLYEAECVRLNVRAKSLSEGLVDYAKLHFGAIARENIMLEYAMRKEHQPALADFLAKEILFFRSTVNPRAERKALHQLALISGEEAAAAALRRATRALGEGAGGGGNVARTSFPGPKCY